MPTVIRLLLVLALLLPLTACKRKKKSDSTNDDSGTSGLLPGVPGPGRPDPSGPPTKDRLAELRAERPMPAFTGVTLGLVGDAVVTTGDKYSVKVEAPDDVLPLIETKVVAGQLTLGLRQNEAVGGSPTVKYTVVAPKLDTARASFGRLDVPKLSGDVVRVEAGVKGRVHVGQVTARQLNVTIGPSGSVTLAGQAEDVTVGKGIQFRGTFKQLTVSEQGKVQVTGSLPTLTAEVASSDSFEASGDLGAVNLTIAGSGNVTVTGKIGSLRANLAGSGELTASGTAATLAVEAAGSGKVTADQLQAEAAVVKASSAAEVTVWATKLLTATAENSGVIKYKGSPKLTRRVENSGEILPLGK